MIKVLERIRLQGKWIEYWFQDSINDGTYKFDMCSKAGYFWRCLEDDSIMYDQILNDGVRGFSIEFDEFEHPIRIFKATRGCDKPPDGWSCSRDEGHEGPCAASQTN